MMDGKPDKPLQAKAYGHIPHFPGSRMGAGDHHCPPGQLSYATVKVRDRHDRVIVEEKLDGSCVAVAKIDGQIVPLIRAGYRAVSSKYEQHRLFHLWCWLPENMDRFSRLLGEGERVVGEWLAQAHSTRYELNAGSVFQALNPGPQPFVAFDLMRGVERSPREEFHFRVGAVGLDMPTVLHSGGAFSIEQALAELGTHGHHGAIDPVEGAVWRVERHGKVDYLAKFVKLDKVDGIYLPEVSGKPAVWNWRPS